MGQSIVSPRDVIKVNITFPGQQTSAIRPALVISNSVCLQNSDTFIVLPLTRNPPDQYMIPITNSDFEDGSLPYSSNVICDNIFTFEQSEYRGRHGKVTKNFFQKIIDKMTKDVIESYSSKIS